MASALWERLVSYVVSHSITIPPVLKSLFAHFDKRKRGWRDIRKFKNFSVGHDLCFEKLSPHSEFNPFNGEPVHLYQIWLFPERKGIEPSYEQKQFADDEMTNRLRLVASPDASDGSLMIHQDARIYLAKITANQRITHELSPDRHAWLQVLRGGVTLNGTRLTTSDGVAVSKEQNLEIVAVETAEIMLFDLP